MSRLISKLWCGGSIMLALADSGLERAEEAYPDRPIKLIVGFGARGRTDIPARFIADKLGTLRRQARHCRKQGQGIGPDRNQLRAPQPRDGYNLLLCIHFESINTAFYK